MLWPTLTQDGSSDEDHSKDWVWSSEDYLGTFQGLDNRVDYVWWNGHSKGIFKVKKGYKKLNQAEPQITNWP